MKYFIILTGPFLSVGQFNRCVFNLDPQILVSKPCDFSGKKWDVETWSKKGL